MPTFDTLKWLLFDLEDQDGRDLYVHQCAKSLRREAGKLRNKAAKIEQQALELERDLLGRRLNGTIV